MADVGADGVAVGPGQGQRKGSLLPTWFRTTPRQLNFGIPEAVGDGGVTLHPDDVDGWVQAIESADRTGLGARARAGAAPLVRPCLPELAAAGLIPTAAPAA